MKTAINPSTVTPIETKFIITEDKSILSDTGKMVDLKKGDIVKGISITTSGDMTNDSGTETLTFQNSQHIFNVRKGYRGFVPFFKQYIEEKATETNVVAETFYQKHKNHLLIALALVVGYFTYKKLNK
jgi:hypothetical protein